MTEPEDFLTRWSRRKRVASEVSKVTTDSKTATDSKAATDSRADIDQQPKQPVIVEADKPSAPQAGAQADDTRAEDGFDLSKLPSLDSIGPATDIRSFMQPGVPGALSRAALRRAWAADPAIRDFVELAENAWDFTAKDSMYGFGDLDPEDSKRLLARLFGGADGDQRAADDAAPQAEDAHHNDLKQAASEPPEAKSMGEDASSGEAESLGESASSGEPEATDEMARLQVSDSEQAPAALQQKQSESAPLTPPMRRAHGRALPE